MLIKISFQFSCSCPCPPSPHLPAKTSYEQVTNLKSPIIWKPANSFLFYTSIKIITEKKYFSFFWWLVKYLFKAPWKSIKRRATICFSNCQIVHIQIACWTHYCNRFVLSPWETRIFSPKLCFSFATFLIISWSHQVGQCG